MENELTATKELKAFVKHFYYLAEDAYKTAGIIPHPDFLVKLSLELYTTFMVKHMTETNKKDTPTGIDIFNIFKKE